jgi:desulfoferrodoxin-like iron-binding protein
MKLSSVSRRGFLETVSMVGAAAVWSANFSKASGAEKMPEVTSRIFVCAICGHVEFGNAPDACPVCHADKEKFQLNDALFMDSQKKFANAGDKHLPVIEATAKSPLVTEQPAIAMQTKIGSVIHPMEKGHHIRFIDCYIDDVYVSRLLLTLNSHPTAGINIRKSGTRVRAVILCTLHGYWQNEATVA